MCDEERQSSGRTEMHELPSKADTHNDKVNKFNASTRQRGDRSRTIFSGTFTACSRGLMHPPLSLTHSEERNKLHGQSFNLLHCPLSFSRDLKLGHCHGDNSSQQVCSTLKFLPQLQVGKNTDLLHHRPKNAFLRKHFASLHGFLRARNKGIENLFRAALKQSHRLKILGISKSARQHVKQPQRHIVIRFNVFVANVAPGLKTWRHQKRARQLVNRLCTSSQTLSRGTIFENLCHDSLKSTQRRFIPYSDERDCPRPAPPSAQKSVLAKSRCQLEGSAPGSGVQAHPQPVGRCVGRTPEGSTAHQR